MLELVLPFESWSRGGFVGSCQGGFYGCVRHGVVDRGESGAAQRVNAFTATML